MHVFLLAQTAPRPLAQRAPFLLTQRAPRLLPQRAPSITGPAPVPIAACNARACGSSRAV